MAAQRKLVQPEFDRRLQNTQQLYLIYMYNESNTANYSLIYEIIFDENFSLNETFPLV